MKDLPAVEGARKKIPEVYDYILTWGDSPPRPGWCMWADGSLGNAAGKNRDIVIYARTDSPPFSSFVFTAQGVEIYDERPCCGANKSAGQFTSDVVSAIHGVRLSGGGTGNSNGQVFALVRMIDSRWGLDGAPAFIVVD